MEIEDKNGFRRAILFTPAYDKRNDDPDKNYGVHSVEMRFVLKGPKGAVSFTLYTGWHLKNVQEEYEDKDTGYHINRPLPADLGRHSYVSLHDFDTCIKKCKLLDGKDCYYDGSGLNAYDIYYRFVQYGEDIVWQDLEEYYEHIFSDVNVPEEAKEIKKEEPKEGWVDDVIKNIFEENDKDGE